MSDGLDTDGIGSFDTGVYVAVLTVYIVAVWCPSSYFLYQACAREDDDPFVKPCQCWFEWSWKRQYVCAEVLFRIHFIFSLCSIVVVTAERSYREVWYLALVTVFVMVGLTSGLWYISMLSNGRIPTDADKRALIVRSVRSLTIDQDTAFGDVLKSRKTQLHPPPNPLPVGGSNDDGLKSRSNSHSEGAIRDANEQILGMRVADMHTLSASVELQSLPKEQEKQTDAATAVASSSSSSASTAETAPVSKPIESGPTETKEELTALEVGSAGEAGVTPQSTEVNSTPMSEKDREELDQAWNDAETQVEDEDVTPAAKEELDEPPASVDRVVSDSAVLSP